MQKKPLILIVDDEIGAIETLKGILMEVDCKTSIAYNGEEAIEKIEHQVPDLILLDWTMPGMNGWEVCKKLRKNEKTRHIPVIMLTAKNAPEDEIIALDAGADDYITKPFNINIVLAHVKAMLRRNIDEADREITAAGISINLDKHSVLIEEKPVDLWPKEFDLLYFLMKKRNFAVSRDMLLENVWGYTYFGTTRTVDATIKRLREKLGDKSEKIITVKGVGYKFISEEE